MLTNTYLYCSNGIKSTHKICIQAAVDPMENKNDLAVEEEKEWLQQKSRYINDTRSRRRFNSDDDMDRDAGNKESYNNNNGRNARTYNYYNKDEIVVPPSEYSRLVLIDNVADNVTSSELRQIFSNVGTIEKIFVPETTTNSNRGNNRKRAEILYQDEKSAKSAVKVLNNLQLCQNKLSLKLASSDNNNNIGNNTRRLTTNNPVNNNYNHTRHNNKEEEAGARNDAIKAGIDKLLEI
jgi:hypothetical protein